MDNLIDSMGNDTNTMTKFLTSFLRIGVAMIVLVGLSAGTAMGQDQYVDPVNGDDTDSGSASNPVATIQQALSNAPSNGEIAIRRNQEYNENPSFSVGPYTFTSWNGEDGTDEETGTDAPGTAVLNGDLTIGDASTATSTLTLAEGFTLAFEENRVLTLTGAPGGPGSAIQGPGTVEATSSAGQFIVNIVNDGGNRSVTATLQNFTLNKPGGTFRVRRSPQNTGNETAELQFTDTDATGGGEASFVVDAGNVEMENRSDLSFRAKSDTDTDPTLDLSGASSVTSPGSASGLILDVSGDASNASDSRVFTARGDIDLGLLLQIEDIPEVEGTGSGFTNPAGLIVEYNEIGNGGRSTFNTVDDITGTNTQDQVEFINLTGIVGSFRAQSSANEGMVDAPLLNNITGDLDIQSGAAMRTGTDPSADELTVEGVTTVQGGDADAPKELIVNNSTSGGGADFEEPVTINGADTDVEFNSEETTLEKTFTLVDATADFNGAGDFQEDVNFGSTLNFNAVPGGATSTVGGTFTHNGGGEINLADDTGNGNGFHTLTFNGGVVLSSGTLDLDMQDDFDGNPTFLEFAGSDPQEITGSGSISGADRVRIDNSSGASPAVEFNAGEIEILDVLALRQGRFRVNGGLDMRLGSTGDINPPETAEETDEAFRGEDRSSGTTALRRKLIREVGNNSFLTEGNSSSTVDGEDVAYAVDNNTPQTPFTIEYQGSIDESTGDELLPDGVDEENKSLPELVVNMEASDATISLDTDRYLVASSRTGDDGDERVARLELLEGELSFTTETQLALECRGTIERANADFITRQVVDPLIALEPGYDCPSSPTAGVHGYHLEYTNTEAITAGDTGSPDRGIEWLSQSSINGLSGSAADIRREDEVLDVRVDNEAPVTLASGSGTFRFTQDATITDGGTASELALNGNTLEMLTPDDADGSQSGGVDESGVAGDYDLSENKLNGVGEVAPGEELRIVDSGTISGSGSLLFTGLGQANVIGEPREDVGVFPLPPVTVSKTLADPEETDDQPNQGDRRVHFAVTDSDGAEGFSIGGNFVLEDAQDFGDLNGDGTADTQDGVELASGAASSTDADSSVARVDIFRVQGNFDQQEGSFSGFTLTDGIAASEFDVAGDLTKQSESTRHTVGDRSGTGSSSIGLVDGERSVDGSVADYSVGTDSDSLTQDGGTFYAVVSNSFQVNGSVRNSSADSLTTGSGVDAGSVSEAFGVEGVDLGSSPFTDDRTRALITESVEQNAGTMRLRGFVEDADEDGETTVDDSWIVVGESFLHEGGVTEIPDALLTIVDPDPIPSALSGVIDSEGDGVVVSDSTFRANMAGVDDNGPLEEGGASDSTDSNANRFRASALTVGGSNGSESTTAKDHTGDPATATFEASTKANPSRVTGDVEDRPLIDPPNRPEGNDRLVLTGETRVTADGRYELEGYEHRQAAGGYYLLGRADYHPETDDTSDDLDITDRREFDAGQCGLVRFTGENMQTLKTDGTAETFLNSLSVRSPSDEEPISSGVQLESDVALNQVRCVDANREFKNGVLSSTSPVRGDAVFRPFGTYFAERGVLRTFEGGTAKNHGGTHHELFVLTAEPTDRRDLTEANSADEDRAGAFAATSPVLFGDERAYVSGTMTRAIEDQSEDTGGRLSDGYIFPMGSSPMSVTEAESRNNLQLLEPEYRAMVLQTVTDHTVPGFFTVTAVPKPVDDDGNVIELPDGLADDGLTRQNDRIELDLNALSLPYMRVDFNRPNNFKTFNVRMISDIGDVRGTKVDQVKQMRIVQREEDNNSSSNWQLAGDYDEDAGGALLDDDPDDAGGPNETISGKTNVIHEGVNLDRGQILAFASDESLNAIGQTDAPLVELASDQSSPVSVDVGKDTNISFNITDPDTDPSDFTFSVTGSSNSTIDPDSVSFQSDGTVSFAPDSSAAKASFETSSQSFNALTLEIRVEDPDGNSDVASVGVEVGLQDGDADMDGLVGSPSGNAGEASQDASLALQEFLEGSDTSTPSVLADVAFFDGADIAPNGGDGSVTPFDAAQILGLAFGSNSQALAGKDAAASDGEIIVGDASSGEVSVRLSDNASEVYSAAVKLNLDPAQTNVSGVSSDLPNGWIVDHVTQDDGTVRIGLAGSTPLPGGQEIATVQVGDEAKSNIGSLDPEGTYRLNGADAEDVRVNITPDKFALEENYPNPFSEATTIQYQLGESADVTLEVYDVLGRKVTTLVNKKQSAGSYEVNLGHSAAGQDLSSGMYIYRIEAGDFQDTGKMTVVK